jgi:hypothetical protein
MDNRARASLTYRILTEVLGLSLVFGAYSLSTISYDTAPILARSVVLYTIIFAVLILIWRRLASMFELGILGGKVSGLVGMIIALNIALAPVFLKIFISNDAVRPLAADLLAVGFGLVMLFLMFLVRRSHAYKSKTQWRLAHHALLITGGIFLLSLLVPLSFAPILEIPGRFLIWALALAAMPLFQRVGSGMMANPAQPQRSAPPASATTSSASTAVGAHSSSTSFDHAANEREGQEQHRRPPRRGRGRFHRHSGPSRRRM